MAYLFKTEKAPDGINDVQVITYRGAQHFIASFGRVIKIFTKDLVEVSGFSTQSPVLKILPYQDIYFLVGRNVYYTYRDANMILQDTLNVGSTLHKILAVRDSFIMFHGSTYSIGTISNMRLNFSASLTDISFFSTSSATRLNDTIYIIARTFSKRFIISYSFEDGRFSANRREISNGEYVFRHGYQLMLVDQNGLWGYKDKLYHIKEFWNSKISLVYSDLRMDNGFRSLLFCRNGEIVSIDQDNNTETIGMMDCAIESAACIDDVLFCGSRNYSYVLRMSGKIDITRIYSCIGNVRDFFGGSRMKYLSNKEDVEIRRVVPISRHQEHEEDHEGVGHQLKRVPGAEKFRNERIRMVFQTDLVRIFTFERFSTLNGRLFDAITSCYSHEGTTYFSTRNNLFGYSDKGLTVVYVSSSIARYHSNSALLYSKNELLLLNLTEWSAKKLEIDAEISEIVYNEDSITLITFSGDVMVVDSSLFASCTRSMKILSSMDDIHRFSSLGGISNTLSIDFSPRSPVLTGNSSYLGIRGNLYRLLNGRLNLLRSIGHHIFSITQYRDDLVVSSAGGTFLVDTSRNTCERMDIRSFHSFVCEDRLYVCNGQRIEWISYGVPELVCRKRHNEVPNEKTLLYRDRRVRIFSHLSLDRRTVAYNAEDSRVKEGVDCELLFDNQVETCRCVVRKRMICVCLTNLATKMSRILFLHVKNGRLAIRREIDIEGIGFSVCSHKNNVSLVTERHVTVYKIKNQRIRVARQIPSKDCFCTSSYFVSSSVLMIPNEDWSYKIANTKRGTVKKYRRNGKCIPFAIDGRHGFVMDDMIRFCGKDVCCHESIVHISIQNSILYLFGRNGSIFTFWEDGREVDVPEGLSYSNAVVVVEVD